MTLGYRGNAGWRDMSEYVVHFAKDDPGRTSAYDSMLKILGSGKIHAYTPFGAARSLDVLEDTQKSACFSEIPLDRLNRLVARRSQYGIGFRQDVLVRAGGARVWYLDNDGKPATAFRELKAQFVRSLMDTESPMEYRA